MAQLYPVTPALWALSEGIVSEGQGPAFASLPAWGGGQLGLGWSVLQEPQHYSSCPVSSEGRASPPVLWKGSLGKGGFWW